METMSTDNILGGWTMRRKVIRWNLGEDLRV